MGRVYIHRTHYQSFNIITGPVLYRRASVVDFAALLKGLRIPRLTQVIQERELRQANRPRDRPTKLKLLGYIERIDLPHPPRGLSRLYTTDDPHDPQRIKAVTDRWHGRTRKRWSEAQQLLKSMQSSEGIRVFGRLRYIWIGGLSELLAWRQYSEPSDLWKYRMMVATRITADWIPYDWPIPVGSAPLVPLLAVIAQLDTVCDTTAHKTLGWKFTNHRASPTPPDLSDYPRPRTLITHYATPVFAWSIRDMGRDVNRNLLPLLPGINNVIYCLVDVVDDTQHEFAPLTSNMRDELAAGLYRAFHCTMDNWAAVGCEELVRTTSVTIYGMLGGWNVPPHCLTREEAEAVESGGDFLPSHATDTEDVQWDPIYYSEIAALRAVHTAFKTAMNKTDSMRKGGIADRVRLLPARSSVVEPCRLCGMGCWEI